MPRQHAGTQRTQRPSRSRTTTMDRSIQHDAPGLQAPPSALLPETALGAGLQPQPSLVAHDQEQLANAGADAVLDRESRAIEAPPAVTPPPAPLPATDAPARKVPSWLKPRGKGAAAAVAGGEVPSWLGRKGRKARLPAGEPTTAPAAAVALVARAMAKGVRSGRGGAVAVGSVATAEGMVRAGISPLVIPSSVRRGMGRRWSDGIGSRDAAARAWLRLVVGEPVGLRWFVAAAVAHYGRAVRKAVRRKGKADAGDGGAAGE